MYGGHNAASSGAVAMVQPPSLRTTVDTVKNTTLDKGVDGCRNGCQCDIPVSEPRGWPPVGSVVTGTARDIG